MISLIEALNYRCLRYVRVPVRPFQVLVGPNASGKTTFLDVPAFLSDMIASGPSRGGLRSHAAISPTSFGSDEDAAFELAIEAAIPEEMRQRLADPEYDAVRYEVSLALDRRIKADHDRRRAGIPQDFAAGRLPKSVRSFPTSGNTPRRLLTCGEARYAKAVQQDAEPATTLITPSPVAEKVGWTPSYKLGPHKSTLANLPEDETQVPREHLAEAVPVPRYWIAFS